MYVNISNMLNMLIKAYSKYHTLYVYTLLCFYVSEIEKYMQSDIFLRLTVSKILRMTKYYTSGCSDYDMGSLEL